MRESDVLPVNVRPNLGIKSWQDGRVTLGDQHLEVETTQADMRLQTSTESSGYFQSCCHHTYTIFSQLMDYVERNLQYV